jgi:small subunit ribosomal protein S6
MLAAPGSGATVRSGFTATTAVACDGTDRRYLLVSWRGRADLGGGGARFLLLRKDRSRAVQRRQGKRMRHYEMMIILDPALEERTIQPSLDQFLQVIRSAGGTVDKVDIWGKRRLAYDILKKSEGFYTVVDLTSEPDTVRELDRQLNLNEAVLRTKIVRPDH